MKNILYIFNYQREVPPFMQMQIGIAKNYFDKVYFITRFLSHDNSDTIKYKNVEIIQVSKFSRIIKLLSSPVLALTKFYFIKQLLSKRIHIKRIKHLLKVQFVSDNLYAIGRNLLKQNKYEKNCLLATWFDGEALTIARLKKRNQNIKAISFAHSFEIDPDKNEFVSDNFNEIKHKYIDEVHYISHKMREIYYKACENLNFEILCDNKSRITYLGSIKEFEGFSKLFEEPNKIFRIVSCSGITKVKRLHLILEALKHWDIPDKIEWVHIGDGPFFEDIETGAKELEEMNPNIKIKLLGRKSNKEVQKYYAKHAIDLFVNVSAAEGVPVSIMESASYKIPALATNVGGTGELVINGETGILVDKDCSAYEIYENIRNYLYCSTSKQMQFRERAYSHWNQLFDANVNMNKFYNNLKSSI